MEASDPWTGGRRPAAIKGAKRGARSTGVRSPFVWRWFEVRGNEQYLLHKRLRLCCDDVPPLQLVDGLDSRVELEGLLVDGKGREPALRRHDLYYTVPVIPRGLQCSDIPQGVLELLFRRPEGRRHGNLQQGAGPAGPVRPVLPAAHLRCVKRAGAPEAASRPEPAS